MTVVDADGQCGPAAWHRGVHPVALTRSSAELPGVSSLWGWGRLPLEPEVRGEVYGLVVPPFEIEAGYTVRLAPRPSPPDWHFVLL